MRHSFGILTIALLVIYIGPDRPRVTHAQAVPGTQKSAPTTMPQKAAVKPLIQIDITPGNPTTQPTAFTKQNRIDQHADLLKKTKKVAGKVDLLFIGDSQMQQWCVGPNKDVWLKNYAPLNAFNLGMASSTIEQTLFQVNDGALEGLTPKVVVIHSGMSNIWTSKCTARQLVEGIANLVNAVHEKIPQAKILLIGIHPSSEPDSVYRTVPRDANKELAKFDNGDNLRFFDPTETLIPNDGPASPEIFDKTYRMLLTKRGYELWADAMNPLLSKMLGTPVPPATRPADAPK